MRTLLVLWRDEAGFVVSAELVLVVTLLVLGVIVGIVSIRNQIVQEAVDFGQSIGSASQSYGFSGTKKDSLAWTDGSAYSDKIDFCQSPQSSGNEPGGISVRMMPGGAGLPAGGEIGGGGGGGGHGDGHGDGSHNGGGSGHDNGGGNNGHNNGNHNGSGNGQGNHGNGSNGNNGGSGTDNGGGNQGQNNGNHNGNGNGNNGGS